MKYSVTFYTSIDEYDWACPQHYAAESPQEAAIAERKHIFDECLGLDNYEWFDRCYKDGEPDRTELLVLAEDGHSWRVVIESWPTTYDVRREKPIVWEHVIMSCESTDVRFRWHEFTVDDTDDRDPHEYPYGAAHHVCVNDPCDECIELDTIIADRKKVL